MHFAPFVSIAAVVLVAGCSLNAIEGSGVVDVEMRDVSGFDRVALSHTGNVVLRQGDSEGLSVRADDNLMQYIETEVRNGTLHIGVSPRAATAVLRPTVPITFDVTFKELAGLSVSGSGSFELGDLETPYFEMAVSGSGDIGIAELTAEEVRTTISGSGDISIGGSVARQSVEVSGSGRYMGQDLAAGDSRIQISGSGLVVFEAVERLDVSITGSGTVRYFGSPAVKESISGSGTLESLGERGGPR
jgi:hypothetical protein